MKHYVSQRYGWKIERKRWHVRELLIWVKGLKPCYFKHSKLFWTKNMLFNITLLSCHNTRPYTTTIGHIALLLRIGSYCWSPVDGAWSENISKSGMHRKGFIMRMNTLPCKDSNRLSIINSKSWSKIYTQLIFLYTKYRSHLNMVLTLIKSIHVIGAALQTNKLLNGW